jgi:hypothetical protein
MNADHGLVSEAASGKAAAAIRAMTLEAELRIDTFRRADQFVAEWQGHARRLDKLGREGDYAAMSRVQDRMTAMAKGLHRDPQLESLLRNRVKELGIRTPSGGSLSRELQEHPGLWRGRGLGR